MKISILLGTYGSRLKELDELFSSLDRQTYQNFEVIVGSQTNHEEIGEILKKHSFEYKHVIATGIGPSNSRNVTMDLATGDIYTFGDDDGWYKDDTLEKIIGYFKKYDPDVLSFKHFDPVKKKSTLNYPKKAIMGLNKIQLLRQANLDLWYNAKTIDPHTHKFDERFGTGTKYNSGEENIYLIDAYNEGRKKMYYFPEIMAYHPYKEVNYIDEKSVIGKGPLFKRMFGDNLVMKALFIAFILKKKKLIEKHSKGQFWKILKKALDAQNEFEL